MAKQRHISAAASEIRDLLARANGLQGSGKYAEARALYDRVLALDPRHFDALLTSGVLALLEGSPAIAAELIERAIAIDASRPDAHYNLAIALHDLQSYRQAIDSYRRAIALQPDNASCWFNLGNTQQRLGQFAAAIDSFDRALAIRPDHAVTLNNRGLALGDLGQHDAALQSFDRALALSPDYADAHGNRAGALKALGRFAEAVQSYDRTFALKPDDQFLSGMRLHFKMRMCDWRTLDHDIGAVTAAVERGERASPSFALLAASDDPALHRKAAEIWVHAKCPPGQSLGPLPARPAGKRIRVGYFSADLYSHATAHLMAELFERHDRTRFEIRILVWPEAR